MENNIFEKLQTCDRKSEKKIASFILKYDGDYKKLRIRTIVEEVYVSNATVMRFVKSMGYDSFSELKIDLSNNNELYEGVDHSNPLNTNHDYLNQIINSFKETESINLNSNIDFFIQNLKKNDKIDIYAMGETHAIGLDFQLKLIRIGLNAGAYEDEHTQYFVANNSTKKTLAIGISYSGTTNQVLEKLKIAKKYGAKTILISKKGVKKPKYVDVCLYVMANESVSRVYSTTSRFSILYLLDIVYNKLILANEEYYSTKLKDTRIKRGT